MARKRSAPATSPSDSVTPSAEVRKPLVFISHDTRDAEIAEAFANLLTDASGGVLQSFRSSDRKGIAGIEFGAEWYRAIMDRIDDATDVVALLTTFSVNRPWLLYEAGVAKGKLDRVVFGLAIGIPLSEASVGPFAQFQNSGDDEDSLTKLVLQLIRRNPDADPREEAVRRQVLAFRDTVADLMEGHPQTIDAAPAVEENGAEEIAKLFEEVKAMFRDLPERLDGAVRTQLRRGLSSRRTAVNPVLMEELFYKAESLPPKERVMAWLIALSPVRDQAPWFYDVVLEAQQAVKKNNSPAVRQLARDLYLLFQTSLLQWWLHNSIATGEGDAGLSQLIRSFPDSLDRLSSEMPPTRRSSKPMGLLNYKMPGEDLKP